LVAGAAATALALVALTLISPAAEATLVSAADPDARISPTTSNPSATQTYTVTVEGTDANKVQVVTVAVPSAFTSPSSPSTTVPASWTSSYNSTTHVWTFSTTESSKKLGSGQTLTATITAAAPASSGNYTWPVTAMANPNNGPVAVNPQPVVTVGLLSQTISFGALGNKTFGDTDFTVSATGGGSGNAVTFSVGASDQCTSGGTDGATIHLTGAGSCTVTANQAGGNGYAAATAVSRTFSIAKASQTIIFDAIDTQTFGDGPLTLAATGGSSGNAVTYSASGGHCSVSGTSLNLDSAGECTVYADQAGNDNYDAATQVSRTFTINQADALLELSDLTHDYDGLGHGATVTTTPNGLSGVSVTYDGSATEPTDAGSYDVVATLDNTNYAAEEVPGTLVINPKHITASYTIAGKTYDGDTDATISDCSLNGVLNDDDVDLDCGTATFDSKDAGDEPVNLSGYKLTGTDKDNYVLDTPTAPNATIDPLTITGSIQAGDKNYDCTSAAGSVTPSLDGVLGSDDVKAKVDSASFGNGAVGTSKIVTATLSLTGDDAGNYTLDPTTVTDTANIDAKPLAGSFTASNKTYDGTRSASTTPDSLSGLVCSEVASLVVSNALFDDKNVGTGKTVTADLSVGGANAGNYTIDVVGSDYTATADITARSVAGSFTAGNKVWDGNTAATITGTALAAASGSTGKVAGDDVSITGGSATFDTAVVGTNKTVSGSGFSLTGTDAGNYSLTPAQPWTTQASISALYSSRGFYAPVDMTPTNGDRVYNSVKGGQTVPLKFEVFANGSEQKNVTDVFGDLTAQAAAFKVSPVTCDPFGLVDGVETTTTGGTSLRFDTTGDQFVQNWKTPTQLGCYSVTLKAKDGGTTAGPAYFKITK
jgi:hypothetical protein